jgi:hypothetical protein
MSACGAGLEVQDIGTLGGLHGTACVSGSTAIAINDKGEIVGVSGGLAYSSGDAGRAVIKLARLSRAVSRRSTTLQGASCLVKCP